MATFDNAIVTTLGRGLTSGQPATLTLDASGALVVIDFYMKALLDGRGYQVKAGTITTHLTGDVDITDTAAEMSADAAAGLTIIPVHLNVDIEALGGTLPQVALKSVGAVSSAGTAFVPLPLLMGGTAASTTARVSAAGGVTVTAEANTTTRAHALDHVITGAGKIVINNDLRGRSGVLKGPACLYVQVGTVTTGANYFAALDYLDFPTSILGI
jgi:hypothetical protein